MAAPTLHHVTMQTQRLQEMINWYTLVVGMQVNYAYDGGAWLSNDAANHRVAFLQSAAIVDDADKGRHARMHHVAFEFENGESLLKNYERLRDLEVLPVACVDHGTTVSFYYTDPDGNGVEMQFDAFRDWGLSSEWMRASSDYARDPLGTPIDPELMVRAWHQGSTIDDLHTRARAGDFRPAFEVPMGLPAG